METAQLAEIIRISSNISILFPLALYLARMRYASRKIHIIGAIVIVAGVADLLGYIFSREQQPTAILFNLYYALLFFLLTWFYYNVLYLKDRRVLVLIGLAVYLQSFILITIFVQPFYEYQSLMWIIAGVIMIVFSVAYFIYVLSILPADNRFNYSLLWINFAVLIYFSLNLFLFILSNYVFTEFGSETSLLMWSFHNVNNIVKNVLFAMGLGFYKKKVADF